MKKSKTFAIVMFVVALAAIGTAAQGRRERPGPGSVPPGGAIFEQLGLSAEQKAAIDEIRTKEREASKTYFEQSMAIRDSLRGITETENFNESEARRLLTQKAAIDTELELIRLKTQAAIYNLLTAEQIAKLALQRQQRPERPRPDGLRPPEPPPVKN